MPTQMELWEEEKEEAFGIPTDEQPQQEEEQQPPAKQEEVKDE